MRRRGFTIIELLLVIGILAILMSLVMVTASGSIKAARTKKAMAIKQVVELGFNSYYAQKRQWPGTFGKMVLNGLERKANDLGINGQNVPDLYYLEPRVPSDNKLIHEMIRELVIESHGGNTLVDVSGLFVSTSDGNKHDKKRGRDFVDAIRGTKQNPKKMRVSEMNFGYPDPGTGFFRCFDVIYNMSSDQIMVLMQDEFKDVKYD